MNHKQQLAALSVDLMRVALGFHQGQMKMGERFSDEALKRKDTIDKEKQHSYLQKMLLYMKQSLENENKIKVAEDALMLSGIFQLWALHE